MKFTCLNLSALEVRTDLLTLQTNIRFVTRAQNADIVERYMVL